MKKWSTIATNIKKMSNEKRLAIFPAKRFSTVKNYSNIFFDARSKVGISLS
jgi:hypothetical protein